VLCFREILKRVSLEQEYLTIDEVAARLKCSRRTVINRMASGVYREGIHYFRRKAECKNGRRTHCDPLFKWSAIVAWVEAQPIGEQSNGIPMSKGVFVP